MLHFVSEFPPFQDLSGEFLCFRAKTEASSLHQEENSWEKPLHCTDVYVIALSTLLISF